MVRISGMRAAALAAAIGCALGTLPGSARAEEPTGWRVGSVVATALYAPAKVLYATTGVIAGGLGWGLSGGNRAALDAVLTPALHGDYVVTPEHLRGERRLRFVGTGPDAPVAGSFASEDAELELEGSPFDEPQGPPFDELEGFAFDE